MLFEDFILASLEAKTVENLFALYQKAMGNLGFDRLIFSLMTDHVAISRKAGHGIASNYPDDWMAYYSERRFVEIDPVRGGMFASSGPFVWGEMEKTQPLTRKQTLFMHEGREAGLLSGIGIPLRGAKGSIAGIGAASSEEHVDLTPEILAKANLYSMQFYTVFLELEKKETPFFEIKISNKERDILQWTARGKTRAEIAIILGISPHTVNIHVSNILKKFETNTITVAAFRALHMFLIQL